MKGELLILFVILLLALILCSFLGGNCGKEGMENGQTYYGPNGASAQLQTDSTGNNSLVVTTSDGTSTTYLNTNSDMYTGPNGSTATVKQGTNGTAVQVKDSSGNIVLTLTNNSNNGNSTATTQNGTSANTSTTTTNYDNYNHYNGSSYPTTFYGPDGGTARVIKTDNNNTIVITNKNGTTDIYYIDSNGSTSTYTGKNGGSAKMITDSNGNQAVEITGPNGSKLVYTGDNAYTYNSQDDTINQYDSNNNTTGTDVNETTYYGPNGGQATTVTGPGGNTYASYDSSAYYNSLPQGVSRSQIPAGEEDLYILKSQVVPPVCAACPNPIVKCPDSTDVTKCPPCEPCGRCAEPAFDCVKRPNYKAFNQDYMPVPVLSDFSSFGM
jgi:hypothetical protein